MLKNKSTNSIPSQLILMPLHQRTIRRRNVRSWTQIHKKISRSTKCSNKGRTLLGSRQTKNNFGLPLHQLGSWWDAPTAFDSSYVLQELSLWMELQYSSLASRVIKLLLQSGCRAEQVIRVIDTHKAHEKEDKLCKKASDTYGCDPVAL